MLAAKVILGQKGVEEAVLGRPPCSLGAVAGWAVRGLAEVAGCCVLDPRNGPSLVCWWAPAFPAAGLSADGARVVT